MMKTRYLILFLSALIASCTYESGRDQNAESYLPASDTLQVLSADSVSNKKILRAIDQEEAEMSPEALQLIRTNFQQINAITDWDSVRTVELWETTEGGEGTYYFADSTLKKIYVRQAGETQQLHTEYYFLSGQISFVYQKRIRYNRPITWDSAAMLESQDDQVFDFTKSTIEEVRSYFVDEKLVKRIVGEESDVSLKNLRKEEKKVLERLRELEEMRW